MQVLTYELSRKKAWLCLAAAAVLCGAAPAQADSPPAFVELDVPYVPTPPEAVALMLDMAGVGERDTVIDLGSGDGRIAIAAVRDRGARRALGVDIDPARVAEAQANARRAGVQDRVDFRRQDLFDTDISQATVLTMYLLPDVNIKMRPVILDRLAPGSRVVSHAFTMGEWNSDRHEIINGRSLYLWIVPAKVAGTWRLQEPARGELTLTLTQAFQRIEVRAQRDGQAVTVSRASLRGTELRFTLEEQGRQREYVGVVRGDALVAADEAGWRAQRLTP
ncbi:50S ribosomal protein L11 methyltransferase [Bordetella hinzii]|uniref:SAM-dependent methyltransferase n=2 Tax=Bordetella hinzii TaxID=103855 RepID=A0AAN1RUW3_9BORD|nr:50S ribosomal protein L11 methyltransferase [Bordetella hinzii]AKQ58050.1 Ribosomal protein L11 methyltransferase [Bordetella hinzii]AZW16596.1 SAM-dependent methyltransferase [Bordetella hinzii]KCB23166.1 ribosomal protein L11 methyltransferase-like protein [Bordetella hinzii OH87 BAL007II]KCB31761.1 ribosomal protein L11 methyltransferase-like protein [Bordetella hinzii CA90 BAL1384]KCB42668.1 ribosomal protein L11 methyltransferase-like protein [Bordetella hinzii 5132]